jgi:TonB family protein
MKSNLFSVIFLLFLIPKLTFSQVTIDKTIYLDSLWNETTKENHNFNNTVVVKDYYSVKKLYEVFYYNKFGKIQIKGTSPTRDLMSQEGEYKYYYDNGNIKQILNYKNSKLNGKCFKWYENGNKKLEAEYIELGVDIYPDLKIYQYWNSKNEQQIIDGNGYFDEISEDKSFYKGNLINGNKDGIWKGFSNSSNLKYTDKYENGKFISGTSIDSNNIEHNYNQLELLPEPKKGIQHFYKYVAKNFTKTKEAISNKIRGKIIVSFIIDEGGKITDQKIIKSLGNGLDEEAIRVISSYKNWNPGEQRGLKIRYPYTVPINIKAN